LPQQLERLLSRRRVFMISSVVLLVFDSDIASELRDMPIYAVDDIIMGVLGAACLAAYHLWIRGVPS